MQSLILSSSNHVTRKLSIPYGIELSQRGPVFLLFCSYKFGWGFDNFRREANTGKGVKLGKGPVYYFKFVLPLLILFILISGLIPKKG